MLLVGDCGLGDASYPYRLCQLYQHSRHLWTIATYLLHCHSLWKSLLVCRHLPCTDCSAILALFPFTCVLVQAGNARGGRPQSLTGFTKFQDMHACLKATMTSHLRSNPRSSRNSYPLLDATPRIDCTACSHLLQLKVEFQQCKLLYMQLLGADEEQSIVQNKGLQGIIQEYGHSLTSNDPRLALEYYWQSAAVVGGSPTIKVHFHRKPHLPSAIACEPSVICLTPYCQL